jgi:hypothetical protein
LGLPPATKAGKSASRIPTDQILDSLRHVLSTAGKKGYDGALLLLDELGKNLEFAARHPDHDDIFLLQRLADEAAGSADHPIVVVAILHQAVTAYSSGLETAGQKEWAKIGGRYEEIVYAHHLDEVANLLATTLSLDINRLPKGTRQESVAAMRTALGLGMYGASAATSLIQLAPNL